MSMVPAMRIPEGPIPPPGGTAREPQVLPPAAQGPRRFRTLQFRSIRTKLLLLVAGVALFMGATSTWYFTTKTTDLLTEQVVKRGTYIATNLAYNSEYGVLTGDPTCLGQLVEYATSANPDAAAAVIIPDAN